MKAGSIPTESKLRWATVGGPGQTSSREVCASRLFSALPWLLKPLADVCNLVALLPRYWTNLILMLRDMSARVSICPALETRLDGIVSALDCRERWTDGSWNV